MNDNKDPEGSGPPEPPEEIPGIAPQDPGHGAQGAQAPGVSGVAQEIQIVITVKGNQLGVQGPLHDTIFMYGTLMRAMDVVRTMRDQAQQKRPPGMTPGGLVIPKGGFIPPQRR